MVIGRRSFTQLLWEGGENESESCSKRANTGLWRVEIGMMHRDEVISRSDLSIWLNFSYFFQAGVHRRVCAVILAVICIAMAAATGPAGAGEVSAEQVVFDKIAAELAGQLHALANLSATNSGAAKVAVAPFKQEKLPLDAAYGREFNDFLVSSLLKASSKRLQIMSRDSLAALISDMINTGRMEATDGDAISALLASAQVDILIIGRIERIGDQLSLSYEAVSSKSATLAQATPRRLPWRSQYERNIDARTLKVAVEDAVRKLAEGAFDLRILRLGGIRFETSGEMTDFSRYLEDDLSVAERVDRALKRRAPVLPPTIHGYSVPPYVIPGSRVWARALYVGQHAWFKARVVKLRAQHPRIHVRFEEDAQGNTHKHALPELDAYLFPSDVAPLA